MELDTLIHSSFDDLFMYILVHNTIRLVFCIEVTYQYLELISSGCAKNSLV